MSLPSLLSGVRTFVGSFLYPPASTETPQQTFNFVTGQVSTDIRVLREKIGEKGNLAINRVGSKIRQAATQRIAEQGRRIGLNLEITGTKIVNGAFGAFSDPEHILLSLASNLQNKLNHS